MKTDILPCEMAVTITHLPRFTITYDLGTPALETLAGELLEQMSLEQRCNACPQKCPEWRRRILRQLKVALATAPTYVKAVLRHGAEHERDSDEGQATPTAAPRRTPFLGLPQEVRPPRPPAPTA